MPIPSLLPDSVDFEVLFNASPNPYVLLAPDLTIMGCNDAYLRVTSRQRPEILGRNIFAAFPSKDLSMRQLRASLERVLQERAPDTLALIHYALSRSTPQGATVFRPSRSRATCSGAPPELAGQSYYDLLDRVYATGEPFVGREMRVALQRRPNAPLEDVYVDFVYQPIVEPDGSITGIFAQGHEVTEQKRARDELRRYQTHLEERVRERTRALEESEAERRRAEEALRQSQKMEAIGQLTGGVAHDFNNILQIISGNLHLLLHELAGHQQAQKRLETAVRAVGRGAKLASQLLAFARRQPLEPKAIHLGRLVRGMDDLLRRALGEAMPPSMPR